MPAASPVRMMQRTKVKITKINFLIAYILNYYFTNKADAGMGANFSAEGSFQAQLKYSPS